MGRVISGSRMLITGASSGIGHALAGLAAEAGARLAITARSAEKLDNTARELSARTGAEVFPIVADVTKQDDRARLLDVMIRRFGGLDVLVNNAGVASFGHFSTSSEEVMRRVMEVNFFAPAELIRSAIPHLTRGNTPAIVNVSSMCGRRGVPAWSEYSASKFALVGLTEALRGEMARFDIDVLLLVPGLTRTSLRQNLLHNTGRMKIDFDSGMPPEKVARAILRSLESNRTERTVGWEARCILGLNRWLPRLVDRLMGRRVRNLYKDSVQPLAIGSQPEKEG